MGLKFKVASLDEVEEGFRSLYEEAEDGSCFNLVIEDLPDLGIPKEKFNEFKNNNRKLFKEKEKLENQLEAFKDIDPEEYAKMKKLLENIDESKLLDEGKIEDVVNSRTERMRNDFMNQIEALSNKIKKATEAETKLKTDLGEAKINNSIQTEVAKTFKIKANALKLIIQEGKQIFSLDEDNQPVARDKDGGKMVGKDGITPLTIKEWVENLPKDFPFLFEEGEGMGSKPGGGKGGKTELQRIKQIKDPSERLRVARKAGVA